MCRTFALQVPSLCRRNDRRREHSCPSIPVLLMNGSPFAIRWFVVTINIYSFKRNCFCLGVAPYVTSRKASSYLANNHNPYALTAIIIPLSAVWFCDRCFAACQFCFLVADFKHRWRAVYKMSDPVLPPCLIVRPTKLMTKKWPITPLYATGPVWRVGKQRRYPFRFCRFWASWLAPARLDEPFHQSGARRDFLATTIANASPKRSAIGCPAPWFNRCEMRNFQPTISSLGSLMGFPSFMP